MVYLLPCKQMNCKEFSFAGIYIYPDGLVSLTGVAYTADRCDSPFVGNSVLCFRSSEFIIRMSRDTLSILKRHLQEKKHSVVLNIIQEHLYFDMYEGVARNKQQIEATAGAVVGEATRQGECTCGLTGGRNYCL
jgi:hypothetical protein